LFTSGLLGRSPKRNCGRRVLAQLSVKGDEQRLIMGKRHAIHLPRVALHLRDELVLVDAAGLKPAVAMKQSTSASSCESAMQWASHA